MRYYVHSYSELEEENKKLKKEIFDLKSKITSVKVDVENELKFLQCLREAGVDDWSGYDIACELYTKKKK